MRVAVGAADLPPVLSAVGLTKRFGGTTALSAASVAIRPAEVHALVGENGAGKSTLIKLWAGVLRPDAGRVEVDGTTLSLTSPHVAEAAGLRFIHQELQLVPYFDAVENIYLGRRYPHRGPWIDRAAMRRAVRTVGADLAPNLPLDRPVSTLSIGHRQMVEVLRAFLHRARVVVMDEPTAALTAAEAARLFAAIAHLKEQGTAVVYVSHRLEEVLALADRATVLRDGRVVATRPVTGLDSATLVALMSGAAHAKRRRDQRQAGKEVLRVNELRTTPHGPGVTLALRAGEIVGLYGLLGAGRSRTLLALFGASQPYGGILLDGRPFRPRSPRHAIDRGLALVPEDRRTQGLNLGRSIRFNLTLPLLSTFRWSARLPLPNAAREDRFVNKVAKALGLRFVGARQAVRELSGGNQQKIVVGRWFGRENAVYLFDEPTRGIDVRAKDDIHHEIRRLAAAGAGILVASSDLPELLDLADKILVLREGSVAAEFDGDTVTPAEVTAACFGQAAA